MVFEELQTECLSSAILHSSPVQLLQVLHFVAAVRMIVCFARTTDNTDLLYFDKILQIVVLALSKQTRSGNMCMQRIESKDPVEGEAKTGEAGLLEVNREQRVSPVFSV